MQRSRKTIALPLAVLVLGLAAAVLLGLRQRNANAATISGRIDAIADQAAADLTHRIGLYEYGLRGARGVFVGAEGLGRGARQRFRQYARSRDIDREFPGARGFGLISRVPRGGEDAFVAGQRADGAPGFRIKYLTAHTQERFVVTFVEPLARNAAAVGVDAGSERNRRSALLSSMATGLPTLTGPITLQQASGLKNRSMLFLLPVYRGGAVPAAASRNARTAGWVYAALVTDEILSDFTLANADYGFVLRDVTDPGREVAVFASHTTDLVADRRLIRARRFPVYGRTWEVAVQPRNAYVTKQNLPSPLALAATLAGAMLLLALMLFLMLSNRERRARSFVKRARMAAIAESSHDAIIATDPDGRVIEWNAAATALFGYGPADAMNQSLVELIVPLEQVREDARTLTQVMAGQTVSTYETIRRHQDRHPIEVELSAAPIRGIGGRVTGLATTIRDIRERNRTAREVRQLNENLEGQVELRTAQLQQFSALQQAILANAGYAIIATDPAGAITLFNPAAEQILGYRASQVLGSTPAMFHDRAEVAQRALELEAELGRPIAPGFEVFIAKAGDAPDVNEWTFIAADGRRTPVMLNVSALRREDGVLIGYLGIAADLSERKSREAVLAVSEQKLRGLFELSPLGIALTDATGAFVEFNAAFQALTGYSQTELRAIDYWKLTPREYEPQEHALIAHIARTGMYGPYEKRYIRKDGTHVPIRLNGVGLQIDGRPYIWSIVEDITIQRSAEATMVDAVAAAEAASRAKSDFLANMSHEIRTPMNAIIGMLQLLQRTTLDSRQRDYADKTATAARTLLAILNDILDFSKIEAGRQVLESHEFGVDTLMREIAVILGGNVGDKDLEIVYDLDPGIPPRLLGDALRLQQVLINLAGNAIKFTPFGEVVVAARVVGRAQARIELEIEVRDTGIGIAADQLVAIFDGFTQAEASTTRRFGGTGLGLAISQRLVRLMGGELQVESERGVGSRFYFSVPFGLPEPAVDTAADDQQIGVGASLRGLKVLVVDDNDSARHSMHDMLRALDWSVDTAESGEAALSRVLTARASERAYDVVFLDWRMPGMDGWETSQRIRHGQGGAVTPLIVMVTAHGRELLAERSAHETSALDGFVMKPVTVSMLLDSVADARASYLPGAQPPASAREPTLALATPGRLAGLSVLVVEDNAANQQVVDELLSAEGAKVAIAGGGAAALNLLGGGQHGYDVVLMDIQMPDMDGFTATRRIRGLGLATLPIIAMTANVLPSDRQASLAAGMNDHIGKPFDLDDLVGRLLHWTHERAPGAPAPSTTLADAGAALTPRTAQAPPILDPAAALRRFGGHRGALDATFERFPAAAGEVLSALQASSAAGDTPTAKRHLHTLKGLAGTAGAERLAALARGHEHAWTGMGPGPEAIAVLRAELAAAVAAMTRLRPPAAAGTADPGPAAIAQTDALPAALRQQLQALLDLLDASNLQALGVFAGIHSDLERHRSRPAADIEAALHSLAFGDAATVVRNMLGSAEKP